MYGWHWKMDVVQFFALCKIFTPRFVCLVASVCLLGWSDIALFAIFVNGHIAADQLHLYPFNSEKSSSFATQTPRSRAARFFHLFYQRSLQNSYFLKICKYLPFTLKSNRPKENSKWKETLKTSWVTVIFFFKNHSTLLYMEVSAPPPSPREDKKLLWRCPSNRWLTATLSSPTIFHFLHYTVYSIQYTVHSIQHTVHSTH